jgi:hypothetical protein
LEGVVWGVEVGAADAEEDDCGVPDLPARRRVGSHFCQQLVAGLAVTSEIGHVDPRVQALAHESRITFDPAETGGISVAGRFGVAERDDLQSGGCARLRWHGRGGRCVARVAPARGREQGQRGQGQERGRQEPMMAPAARSIRCGHVVLASR